MRVDIWSDIVCPWCYIGIARFDRALARFGGEMTLALHPFQLDPDAPIPGEPARERYRRRFGAKAEPMFERVASEASALSLPLDWDRAITANTFDAHRLIALGRAASADREIERRLFRAYFADGLDVSDRDVLAEIAAAAGLNAGAAATYLESDDGVDALRGELIQAMDRGVTAVPTFVFEDEFIVPGAVDETTFVRILEQMRTAS